MKVIIVGEWRVARRVRRVCAGWMKKRKSCWWNGGRMFRTRTAGFPTMSRG